MLQEQLSYPAALVGIFDQERHLGMITFSAVVAPDCDHVLTEGDDECHPIHVIDLGEQLDVPISQPRVRHEEAEVLRLRRDPFIKGDQPVCIGWPDRAQMGNATVGQQDVRLPLSRVSGRIRVRLPRGLAHGHGKKPTQCLMLAPLAADRALESAYFVVTRVRKACPLAPPQHSGAQSGVDCSLRSLQIALWNPPTSSSLGDEKRVPSLLLSTAARNPQGTSLAAFDVQRQAVFMKSAQE